jgi:thermitase
LKKLKTILCLFAISIMIFCLIPSLSINVEAKPKPTEYVPGEVIIGLKDTSTTAVQPILSQLGATVKRDIPELNAVVVRVAAGTEDSFMQSVKEMPGVAYVERNGEYHAAIVPNDTYWPYQWDMAMIKANAAWDTYQGWSEIKIAIVDSGIDYNHPDLAANYLAGGYDWVNNDFDPMDDASHGTHCAGIAAAVLNNAAGVAGVAQVKVLAEKVLDNTGSGGWDDAASGIIHATDMGVEVISMSMGGYGYSSLVESACAYAWSHGVVLVAAAGNDHLSIDTYPFYPACYSTVIAVSATNSLDNFDSSYSNYGTAVEVSAPGTSILSTVPGNGYAYKTGTSMACPHVAGLVALIRSYKPQLTNSQVRSALQTAVDDKGTAGKDIYYGYGRINCQKIISSPEKYQYKLGMSGFADRIYLNVSPQSGGALLSGKVNLTSPNVNYPAPVLGWGSGNTFYLAFDYRKSASSYDLGLLVGTISTRSGKLYRTMDGVTWIGPTTVSLTSIAEATEDQPSTAENVEATAIKYVEGYNPTGTVASYAFTGGWYGLQYTPSVSYPLKKVEFMTGLKTGPFVVQLRPDNGTGYPSNTVLREVTFTMSSTVGWQGAEFPTSYGVTAGVTYWIVFQPVAGARFPAATSGTLYTHTWDNFANGIGWNYKGTAYAWMARFYREVQPTYKYHFQLSPFIDRVYLSTSSQSGGALLYGLANVTSDSLVYPAPLLGWGAGNSFYPVFDYRTSVGSGAYELGFVVGTISSKSGNLYRTQDGVTWYGPTAISLVSFTEASEAKPSSTP